MMDRSVSYALEKIACSSVVLKSEQATCIYKGKDVKYAVRVRAPTDDTYVIMGPLVKFYVNCPRLLQ